MKNPWLDIPAADYVGHMSSPDVQQHQTLAGLFEEALRAARPETVLLAGSALGNGLERVDPSVTRRVTCVDINPHYLERIEKDFGTLACSLELLCADLNTHEVEPRSFDLVFAGLVLEYIDWRLVLPKLASAPRAGGTLAVILQLPSDHTPVVTPSKFTSLSALEPLFHFVDPAALVEIARHEGLEVAMRRTHPLPSRKAFEVIHFMRPGALRGVRSSSRDV